MEEKPEVYSLKCKYILLLAYLYLLFQVCQINIFRIYAQLYFNISVEMYPILSVDTFLRCISDLISSKMLFGSNFMYYMLYICITLTLDKNATKELWAVKANWVLQSPLETFSRFKSRIRFYRAVQRLPMGYIYVYIL